jgi:hypothetical protein
MSTYQSSRTRRCLISVERGHSLAILAVSWVTILFGVDTIQAEAYFEDDRDHLDIGLQQSYQSWRIEDGETGESYTIRQYSARMLSTVDVGDRFDVVVYTAGGFSDRRAANTDQVAGLADTKLKGFGHLWDGRILLSLGVNLPTGRTSLNDEEISAVRGVSPTVLDFRMRRYGEGLDLDLGASVGLEVGSGWNVGGGIGFLGKGEYDLDTRTKYEPGDEFSMILGADYRRHGLLVTFDAVYRFYGEDQFGDEGTFRDGSQIEFTTSASWQSKRIGAELSVRNIYKYDSEFDPRTAGSDSRVSNGNNLWVAGAPVFRPSRVLVVRVPVEFTAIEQSQMQAGRAHTFGYGVGIDLKLRREITMELRAMRRTGSVDQGDIDLKGFDGLVALHWLY